MIARTSTSFPRYGDKANSDFFEEFLQRLIEEYLTLSSYYYWGSYDIADQNSSTNVTKSVHHANELESPAKVFTAANHPYFVNHLLKLPSPTEAFVRNFGPRLHHLAVASASAIFRASSPRTTWPPSRMRPASTRRARR